MFCNIFYENHAVYVIMSKNGVKPERPQMTTWRRNHTKMGGASSTYWGEVHRGFWWGNIREEDHLEDSGVDDRLIRIIIIRIIIWSMVS